MAQVKSFSKGEFKYQSPLYKDLNKWTYYTTIPIFSLNIKLIQYPLQLIKTRLQVIDQYTSTWNAFRSIVRNEGFFSLYQGFSMNLFRIFNVLIYMGLFEEAKQTILNLNDKSAIFSQEKIHHVSSGIAGGFASITMQMITCPLDIITQRRQIVQIDKQSSSIKNIVKNLYRQNGMMSFYRGYFISILQYAPGSALNWYSWSMISQSMTDIYSKYDDLSSNKIQKLICINAISGGVAGMIVATILAPFDCIRTRLQVIDKGTGPNIRQTMLDIQNEYGIRGFYRGVVPRMILMGPMMSIMFGCYEGLKWLCVDNKKEFML